MASRLLTGAVAAIGISVGVAGLVVSGNQNQSSAGQPPAGQRGAGDGQARGGGQASDPVLSPGPSAARFPRNADEFDQMFNQVKNWGRWGQNDQLGAANLITDAKRKQAASLVKVGTAVSLAHPPLTETAPDNPQDRKSTRLNSSHIQKSRMPSSA